ncbi:phosphotransferase enzyme family protein [Paenibacillus sp. NFR01]|uniref:phosphotransferase enzyme family protein n=1 Tax=Paenibacillus sp. NFR01 TaxID=1566279 RepID=UPI0008D10EBD|nr:phosphotransferase [Paenibacillus sp. NFR01]SET68623.1 Ser/Thr protein kinase RdoA involved in Cpx stress response, MazF antagonist [Paenibacillus sp. NFR01]
MFTETQILEHLNREHRSGFHDMVWFRDGGSLSYLIRSGDQRYFLKIIRPQMLETAIQSIGIHLYLRRHQFPVPAIIPGRTGSPYSIAETAQGRYLFVVYEYLEGAEPDIHQHAESIGSLTGVFHALMQGYSGPLTERGKDFFLDRYLGILKKKNYPEPKWQAYANYGNELWARVKHLPYGYCHGDLNRGNLLQTASGDIYLLDLDTSCRSFPLYDIALVCNCTDYFRFEEKDYAETRDILERFLSGYTQHREISARMRAAIFDLIALMHYQLQATIIEIYGLDCVDERFVDDQLEWLQKWQKASRG